MAFVRSFTSFRPSPRYDSVPWNRVRVQEAPAPTGPWTTIDTQGLSPLDADPSKPANRSFTTDDATLADGWYKIVFLDASDLEDAATPIKFPETGGYPTVSELVGESDVVALTALSPDGQEALWLATKLAIDMYTNQTFDYQPGVTRTMDGSGKRVQYVPKRLDSMTALSVTGSGLTLSDVLISEQHDKIEVRPTAGFSSYYVRAMMEIQDNPPLSFVPGTGTVQITGNWGWPGFPAPIREAMRLDMEDQAVSDTSSLSEQLRAYRKLGVRDISQDALSVGFTEYEARFINLSDRVRTLLDAYIWQGSIGVAI